MSGFNKIYRRILKAKLNWVRQIVSTIFRVHAEVHGLVMSQVDLSRRDKVLKESLSCMWRTF